MSTTTTITAIRRDPPCWLVVMLLLCSAGFFLPLEGNNCNRPSIQDELVYHARCCKGRAIGYLRALAAYAPSCEYKVPVTYILAFADQQTHIQLRRAAETCRNFETVRHLPQQKILPEASPTDPPFFMQGFFLM